MRWRVILLLIIMPYLLYNKCMAADTFSSDIYLSSRVIPQGGIVTIKIRAFNNEIPHVIWMNKDLSLVMNSAKTQWQGILSADLTTSPGYYILHVKMRPSDTEGQIELEVIGKDYGEERLTLPAHLLEFDDKTLKRVLKEQRELERIFVNPAPDPLWRGPFLTPVPGEVLSPFGRKRIINDQPRSPHTGVDMRGQAGTPIMAINNGKVVFTDEQFLTGKSVLIDHGGGIFSMYFHMEKVNVACGQVIKKGDIIGLVGSTGRASGPHLHWGVRVNNYRIDPMMLLTLSQELEE